MSLLKVIFLCITLFISVHCTDPFPDVPLGYVTNECREKATTFKISQGMSIPLGYDSAQFCMYQNLQVLETMTSLDLALTTPHTGRSICRIEVHLFDKRARQVNMTIYDTDLLGDCTPRNATVIVMAHEDQRTKELSELEIPRKIGWKAQSTHKKKARLLFTDYKKCLILITPYFNGKVKYCELFVASTNSNNMYNTQCHSIYRIYCGYGRPTRDEWPNPAKSSNDETFLQQVHKLRLLIEHTNPLKEDTIFMNEFQMITEVLYKIPEANLLASTSEGAKSKRICAIQIYKIMPDFASLEVRAMISGAKYIFSLYSYYSMDANAISPTRISLLDQQAGADPNRRRERRVLVSNFKNCFVLKTINNGNQASFCELFVKNNTDIRTGLEECSFVFLAYCGYPTAVYNESSCYTLK
uniref:Putative salivary lipocalin n=1 Tax=Ixodes ricinus TaxID=34613 RepID=A0A6B0VAB4_IXORI